MGWVWHGLGRMWISAHVLGWAWSGLAMGFDGNGLVLAGDVLVFAWTG
jgi:hypothetical protein